MIGFLSGRLHHQDQGALVIDCSGIGYRVSVPGPVFAQASPGAKLSLYIHTHVKEDQLELFGFQTQSALSLFRSLISVSGIGPKIALAILSTTQDKHILSAITQGEVAFFTAIPGIGQKTAQRLIIELKNKLGGSAELDLSANSNSQQILDALQSFGYSLKEAQKVLPQLDSSAPLQDQIKSALKNLS